MTQTITATFENGVLKPTQPLDLPEHACVRVTFEPLDWKATQAERLAALERLLAMAKPRGEHLTREQLHERR
jgi:predicted DNA-binding antitoxin AbrB/MazE fold protein